MSRRATFRFRLYVADHALNSVQAIGNLEALCRAHLEGRHEIEIVDVFKDPKRALVDGILMTPTLVKLGPGPVRRIVGTLAQSAVVLHAIGLSSSPLQARAA